MNEWHGIFGKLPEARDFVIRGLPTPVKRGFDFWLTRNVAGRDGDWPYGGLRGLLTFETPALFVAVPSQDKVGRRFPLAALTSGHGVFLEEAETWCDTVYPIVIAASDGRVSLDELVDSFDSAPQRNAGADDGEDAIWTKGTPPLEPTAEAVSSLLAAVDRTATTLK